MLLFESLSVGTIVMLGVMVGVMVVVGVYVNIVWPLTMWDLAEWTQEKYASLAKTALWSLFAGGSLAEYWCVSGRAFKQNPAKKLPTGAARTLTTTRR